MAAGLHFETGAKAVARWARETPEAIAVVEDDAAYSYATLASNIVQAAGFLRSMGPRPGMIVGIETGIQYLHLNLVLAAEVIGAAHFSITPPVFHAP